MSEPLSSEELERMRERHEQEFDVEEFCRHCGERWPCDAARLLSERDAKEQLLQSEHARAEMLANDYNRTLVALDAEREKVKELREEVAIDDRLLANRKRITDECPCPQHGECVPHVMETLRSIPGILARAERAEAERDQLMGVVEAARFLVEVGYHTGGVGTNAIRAALAALDAGEAQHGTKDKP